MRAVDLIRKKRDGFALETAEIDAAIQAVTLGTWPDYQVAALLMAIVCRGMTAQETADLTRAMVRSGAVLDFSGLGRPTVDKHSTGGVGDKTSLVVAPIVAACGATVPMMSGRGLGHTGGTLDKLDAIPGFRTSLAIDDVRRVLADAGCAIVGQTRDIAPADKVLYALRDVTATVESVPLISASIMSKKLAEGVGALVLDVKVGRGAFMKTEADARTLAASLVSIGASAGVATRALLTRMDVPLGLAVGNALEVVEAIDTLRGRGPADLEGLSVDLAARMLVLSGLEPSVGAGMEAAARALGSGAALETFRRMVTAQGGDPHVVDEPSRLPVAPHRRRVAAPRSGYLAGIDAELVGRAAVALGAGRTRITDAVDPAAGALVLVRPGARVRAGEPILELHHRDTPALPEAVALAEAALAVAEAPPVPAPLVVGEVG